MRGGGSETSGPEGTVGDGLDDSLQEQDFKQLKQGI